MLRASFWGKGSMVFFRIRNDIFTMNNWKESDWFKNWLQMARHTDAAQNRPEDPADFCPHDRNIGVATGPREVSVPAQEWQVTE